MHVGEISYRLREPSGVFTSELSAIFMALVRIRDHHPGEFIILSDSMSSLRALLTRKISLVYEIKVATERVRDSYYVDSVSCRCDGQLTSGPFGWRGNSVRPSDFRPLSRVRMLDSEVP
jgi:hypothetical protein